MSKLTSSSNTALSIFIYGKPKTKKTMWATQPVEDNFAVTVLDIENNLFSALVHPHADRVNVLNLRYSPATTAQSTTREDYAPALAFFQALLGAAGRTFYWDEEARKSVPIGMVKPERTYCVVNPAELTYRDVLVLDSWTALLPQVEATKDMNLTKGAAPNPYQLFSDITLGVNISEFGKTRDICDTILNLLTSLPCTVIVIGHEYLWEKKGQDGKTVLGTYSQPLSATGAHGQTLSRWFNMSLRTEQDVADPMSIKISSKPQRSNICGTSVLPPEEISLDNYTLGVVYKKLSRELPSEPYESKAFRFLTGAEIKAEHDSKSTSATTAKTVTVNASGFVR